MTKERASDRKARTASKRSYADRPIEKSEEDLLERGSFARSVAKAILVWKEKDSLVIAIYGKWGSGKSSIKNMIVEHLEDEEPHPEILEFNPWSWSGSNHLSEQFFRELGITIGKMGEPAKSRKLISRLRLYRAYLSTGRHLALGLSGPLRYLVIGALALGFVPTLVLQNVWIQGLLFVLLVSTMITGPVMKWLDELWGKLIEVTSRREEHSERTLSELREEVKEEIGKLDRGVLVIMDDIDRLEKGRVREVMQLVRQNGDFPNVVYLLLFQRDIVENLLSERGRCGREYLEKIVQVPFNLPETEKGRLDEILFRELYSIFGADPKILDRFDRARWENLYHEVLTVHFQTLRDVYRFLSTLAFHVSLHRSAHAFEVNPVDLAAMETLRVFEPGFHHAIFRARHIVTNAGRTAIEKDVEQLFESVPPEFRSKAKELTARLFPTVEWALGGMEYDPSFHEEWFQELRVCSPEVFPKYFQLSLERGHIGQSELEELIRASSERKELVRRMETIRKEGRLASALAQLSVYREKVPLEHVGGFVPAMLDLGDRIHVGETAFVAISPHRRIERILYGYLMQVPTVTERSELLEAAFRESESLAIMFELLATEIFRRNKKQPTEKCLITDECLEKSKFIFVARVKREAERNPGKLVVNDNLSKILYGWNQWGDGQAAKRWVSNIVNSDEHVAALLNAFSTVDEWGEVPDRTVRRVRKFEAKALLDYVDEDRLRTRLKHLVSAGTDCDSREVADIALKALIREDGEHDR